MNCVPADALQEVVEHELAAQHVTGAAVGVVHADEVTIACAGFADHATRRPVTDSTPFLIGSVAKTWTATVLMRLVQGGRIDLDEPVVSYVPDLALMSQRATEVLTLRHLLTHSCGIDEDLAVAASDRSDDGLESYVGQFGRLGQIHAPGELFSYSNSGFVLAGLIAERIVGERFDDVMTDLLIEPLELEDTFLVGSEQSRETATGYRAGWRGQRVETSERLPRAYGPAGSTIAASVSDVIRFARVHLAAVDDERAARILGAGGRTAMRRPERRLPWARSADDASVGLGWMRCRIGPYAVLFHGGGNIGQQCGLVVVPSANLAIATLTNAHTCPRFHAAMIDLVMSEVLGIDDHFAPMQVECGEATVDTRACVGDYERRSLAVRVSEANGTLRCRVVRRSQDVRLGTGESALTSVLQRLFSVRLSPCRDGVLVTPRSKDEQTRGTPFVFTQRGGEGPAEHLQIAYSALRRVDG